MLLQTARGVTVLDKEVEASIPGAGVRKALLNPEGPDMASWGQFVYEDDWVVEHWSKRHGLHMRDGKGKKVHTHMDGYVPCLGKDPGFSHGHADVGLSVAVDSVEDEFMDVADYCMECTVSPVDELVAELHSYSEELATLVENLLHDASCCTAYAFAGTEVQRHPNLFSSVDPEVPRRLPLIHLLAHFPKMKGCPACESGKMTRTASYRVVEQKQKLDEFVPEQEELSVQNSSMNIDELND